MGEWRLNVSARNRLSLLRCEIVAIFLDKPYWDMILSTIDRKKRETYECH
jgi:hypothetical protein